MKQFLCFALALSLLSTACTSTTVTSLSATTTPTEMLIIPTPTKTPILFAELPTAPKILWTSKCDPRINRCGGTENQTDKLEGNLADLKEFYPAIDSVNGTIIYDIPYSKQDLESYSMVIVDFCYATNENTTSAIRQYIESGGSAIITGSDWCHPVPHNTSWYASQITKDFGVIFTDDNDNANQWSNSIIDHPITSGVNKLFFFRHAYLNVTSPSQTIVEVNGKPVMAIYDGTGTFIALSSEHFQLGANFNEKIASSDNSVLWLNAIKWLISQSQEKR